MDKVKKEAIMKARTFDELLDANTEIQEHLSATSLMLMLRLSVLQRLLKRNGFAPDLPKNSLQNELAPKRHISLAWRMGSLIYN